MFDNRLAKWIALALCVAFAACSPLTTDLTESTAFPEKITAPIDRILVVGVSDNGPVRNRFEHELEKNLEKHGVDVVRSLEELELDEQINKETFQKHFTDNDIKAVMVTQVINEEKLPVYTERPSTVDPVGAITTWYDYYYQSYAQAAEGGHYEEARILVLDSRIYAVDSEELIWDCKSKSFAKENTEKVLSDLGKLLTKAMIEDEIISK